LTRISESYPSCVTEQGIKEEEEDDETYFGYILYCIQGRNVTRFTLLLITYEMMKVIF
jgi:hypothetical protein